MVDDQKPAPLKSEGCGTQEKNYGFVVRRT